MHRLLPFALKPGVAIKKLRGKFPQKKRKQEIDKFISSHKDHEGGNEPSPGGIFLRFITTTSSMPSGRKLGENKRGSTGPGKLKEMVNGPGGHSC